VNYAARKILLGDKSSQKCIYSVPAQETVKDHAKFCWLPVSDDTRNGIMELSQWAPPIFGWAAITLGIGPHSSLVYFPVLCICKIYDVQKSKLLIQFCINGPN